jgi:hypothetical protein
MVEIAKRKIEMDSIFPVYQYFQVSINDDGHIVLRWYNKDGKDVNKLEEVGKELKMKRETTDFIIVLTKNETDELIRFIRSITRSDC